MSDIGKLNKAVQRAENAQRILDDPLVVEAFEKMESTLDELWKGSHPSDDEGRKRIYLSYRLLRNFKREFKNAINTGKIAQEELIRTRKKTILERMTRG